MKKLILVLAITLTLSGCAALDMFFGIDEAGNDKEGPAPSEYLAKMLEALGPLGLAASGVIGVGGAAYVGNKKSKDPLKSVIKAIEEHKNKLSDDDKAELVATLKKSIPDKYHKLIDAIKGNL